MIFQLAGDKKPSCEGFVFGWIGTWLRSLTHWRAQLDKRPIWASYVCDRLAPWLHLGVFDGLCAGRYCSVKGRMNVISGERDLNTQRQERVTGCNVALRKVGLAQFVRSKG